MSRAVSVVVVGEDVWVCQRAAESVSRLSSSLESNTGMQHTRPRTATRTPRCACPKKDPNDNTLSAILLRAITCPTDPLVAHFRTRRDGFVVPKYYQGLEAIGGGAYVNAPPPCKHGRDGMCVNWLAQRLLCLHLALRTLQVAMMTLCAACRA